MPLIAAMDQPNLQTPKNYQLFFIPSSAHSIVAFCPFTRVAARGDSVRMDVFRRRQFLLDPLCSFLYIYMFDLMSNMVCHRSFVRTNASILCELESVCVFRFRRYRVFRIGFYSLECSFLKEDFRFRKRCCRAKFIGAASHVPACFRHGNASSAINNTLTPTAVVTMTLLVVVTSAVKRQSRQPTLTMVKLLQSVLVVPLLPVSPNVHVCRARAKIP